MRIITHRGLGAIEWLSEPTVYSAEDKAKFTAIRKRSKETRLSTMNRAQRRAAQVRM